MPRVFLLTIPFVLMLQHSLAQCDTTTLASMSIAHGAKLLKEYQLKKRECSSYSYVFVKNSTYAVYIRQPKKNDTALGFSLYTIRLDRK